MSDYYTVVKGDTLAKIAKAHGTTVGELLKLNEITNPNRLQVGQRIALRRETVLGFQVLFLDHCRDPIKGIEYVLEFAGNTITGITPENGLGKNIFTEAAKDQVRILVRRLDGTLKEVGNVISGYGNKLVTLISPSVKVDTRTERHPDFKPGQSPNPKEPIRPAFDPKAKQKPTNDKKPGLDKKNTATEDGKPVTVVKGDIPDLSFLDEYNGEVMNEADYDWAAKELNVEQAAIKAFAIVESGGGGYIIVNKQKVPKILYERHYFAGLTKNKYSANYPDISLPNGYYVNNFKYLEADANYKKKKGVPENVHYYRALNRKNDTKEIQDQALELSDLIKLGKINSATDKYIYGVKNYSRLTKAYQLDKESALQSCSWGAFQIMGSNWKAMGYKSVDDFVRAMSRSEKEQIKAFVQYIKKVKPEIANALRDHDWAKAAYLYNGANYKQNKYDILLEKQFKKIKGIQ